ncbi:hypothetical protein [Mesorhizobium salmacidum]|uniref:Uncharacterized protein n=1 Tax=Mesorhizobium salmacidum TaxID=3015171 RepID=A0ABU8L506_9HYPH
MRLEGTGTYLQACEHQAAALPIDRFARSHRIVEQAELLFFRGYSGENSRYGFGTHETNGSGYCSQEKHGSSDDQTFEMLWEPSKTEFTNGTSAEAKKVMKYDDPGGFSGSLVCG